MLLPIPQFGALQAEGDQRDPKAHNGEKCGKIAKAPRSVNQQIDHLECGGQYEQGASSSEPTSQSHVLPGLPFTAKMSSRHETTMPQTVISAASLLASSSTPCSATARPISPKTPALVRIRYRQCGRGPAAQTW
jgi:hypothetical protein